MQAVAAKYLQRNNRTVGMYIPTEKPERIAIPSTPDVDTLVSNYKGRDPIAAGEAFDVSPANLEARTLWLTVPEGIKVALLPRKRAVKRCTRSSPCVTATQRTSRTSKRLPVSCRR